MLNLTIHRPFRKSPRNCRNNTMLERIRSDVEVWIGRRVDSELSTTRKRNPVISRDQAPLKVALATFSVWNDRSSNGHYVSRGAGSLRVDSIKNEGVRHSSALARLSRGRVNWRGDRDRPEHYATGKSDQVSSTQARSLEIPNGRRSQYGSPPSYANNARKASKRILDASDNWHALFSAQTWIFFPTSFHL